MATAPSRAPAKPTAPPRTEPVNGFPTASERLRMRADALTMVGANARSLPVDRDGWEALGQELLAELRLGESCLGYAMVALFSAASHARVMGIAPQRRLLLVPSSTCDGAAAPGDALAGLIDEARQRGYQVCLASGLMQAAEQLMGGGAEAVLGVAPLDDLERAFAFVQSSGIPCMAVPIATRDASVAADLEAIAELVRLPYDPEGGCGISYVARLREASELFQPERLRQLVGHRRTGPQIESPGPLALTEQISLDFLAKGGKHSRPFITLAAYEAMRIGPPLGGLATWPLGVLRTALAIETFHKASLVHDDIEDDDPFRYGVATLHRAHGTPMAINIGDYLIGLGYRLASHDPQGQIDPAATAEIVARLAAAHVELAEGQGAELAWREASNQQITPHDVLEIYALKTAPAFAAALFAGCRLAEEVSARLREQLDEFARNLGVAFQITNDLDDFQAERNNKRESGGDALQGRPTLPFALALAQLEPSEAAELLNATTQRGGQNSLVRIRELYKRAGAFEEARRLVLEHQRQAREIAAEIEPAALARLLGYLVEMVVLRYAPGRAGT